MYSKGNVSRGGSVRYQFLLLALVALLLAFIPGAVQGKGATQPEANVHVMAIGAPLTAVEIVAGAEHTCARLSNGSVKCWGANYSGQLGLGNEVDRGDAANEMGANLPTVDLGTGRTALQLAAGSEHTCALLDNNTVKCWGFNSQGQLGLGNLSTHGRLPGTMGDNLPAVDLGTGLTALQVTAGGFHTCALLSNNTVKCWGHNGQGRLGLGNTDHRGDNANEMGNNLPAVDLGPGLTAVEVTGGSNTVAPGLITGW